MSPTFQNDLASKTGSSFLSDRLDSVTARYARESSTRLNENGLKQYLDPAKSSCYQSLLEDPWVKPYELVNSPIPSGGHCKVLIVGAGFGGILFAVNLLEAGFQVEDIVMIDPAGGFGGTWWWNRYPGLMCDVESYIYLPKLEDTGYIPKQKYTRGEEIREYAQLLATQFGLDARAMFQSSVQSCTWDPMKQEWASQICVRPKRGAQGTVDIRSDFVLFATGLLSNIKLPDLPGMGLYQGRTFHSGRWDYNFTGGSQENPVMTGLQDKTVALVGTGATGVQILPHAAQYAGQLFVVQRTPSSVDVRDNKDTDLSEWHADIAIENGWQRMRADNFEDHLNNTQPPPKVDLVDDYLTKMLTFSAAVGTPMQIGAHNMTDYVNYLHALDFPRQERIRKRVKDTVQDPLTAQKLEPWYPGWCKRPCFNDSYLASFNLPNVHLIDTRGKSIQEITEQGLVVDGKEYPVDVIIWATGYLTPLIGSPAGKARVAVTGKDGRDLEEASRNGSWATLHGITCRGFPNMFWPGSAQGASSVNRMHHLDNVTAHIAWIMRRASEKAINGRPVIEPHDRAVQQWVSRISAGAPTFAAMRGCTPSYYNREGENDRATPGQKAEIATQVPWSKGSTAFASMLQDWRERNGLDELDIATAGT